MHVNMQWHVPVYAPVHFVLWVWHVWVPAAAGASACDDSLFFAWFSQVEHHSVMTDDGYILGIHRIVAPFTNTHDWNSTVLSTVSMSATGGSCSSGGKLGDDGDVVTPTFNSTVRNVNDSEYLDTMPDNSGSGTTRTPPPSTRPLAPAPRPVVLLMHGLMQDSECFMVDSRERALAFWLYDAGFDVW
jgi:hypothetical protein